MSVLWPLKILLGRLSRLFSLLSPLLSVCLKRLSRKMSKPVLLWECDSFKLQMRIPESQACFILYHSSHFECDRGSLSRLEFIRYCYKFLEVYKKML